VRGNTLPEWLKNAITLERLEMNMRTLKGKEMGGTDAALTQPMDRDWTQIYLYTAGKVCRQHKQTEASQDILVESLNDEQMRDLNRLKEWLYRERTQIRLDRECTERRQKRGEEIDRRKAEQPALFEF